MYAPSPFLHGIFCRRQYKKRPSLTVLQGQAPDITAPAVPPCLTRAVLISGTRSAHFHPHMSKRQPRIPAVTRGSRSKLLLISPATRARSCSVQASSERRFAPTLCGPYKPDAAFDEASTQALRSLVKGSIFRDFLRIIGLDCGFYFCIIIAHRPRVCQVLCRTVFPSSLRAGGSFRFYAAPGAYHVSFAHWGRNSSPRGYAHRRSAQGHGS